MGGPMIRKFAYVPLLCLAASSVFAQEAPGDVQGLVTTEIIEEIKEWAKAPVVRFSVEAQNHRRGSLSEDAIAALDKQWSDEKEAQDKPLIAASLSNPLSNFLVKRQALSTGLYTEIIVVDSNGLNVGQSTITQDYWQGDEDKFQKTFAVGPTGLFIDKPEYDEALKIWTSQVSMTLTDEAESEAIGALTVQINLTELSRRRAPVF
jgi:hypothetical protein